MTTRLAHDNFIHVGLFTDLTSTNLLTELFSHDPQRLARELLQRHIREAVAVGRQTFDICALERERDAGQGLDLARCWVERGRSVVA